MWEVPCEPHQDKWNICHHSKDCSKRLRHSLRGKVEEETQFWPFLSVFWTLYSTLLKVVTALPVLLILLLQTEFTKSGTLIQGKKSTYGTKIRTTSF